MDGRESETAAGLMTIRAFSRRSRLTQRALRLYDASGLLAPAFVDEQTGYRYYTEAQLEVARLIVLMRQLEMPLSRIAGLLDLSPAEQAEAVQRFWLEAEAKAQRQRKLAGYLRGRLLGRPETRLAVQTREVGAQKVLVLGREILRPELQGFIVEAFAALYGHLDAAPARPVGSPMLIYHWELDFDSPGLVEACMPFEGSAEPAPGLAVRLEPAHREAFVRLTKAQADYPDILHAYDALSGWLEARSLVGLAPREVYFAPWDATPPDQPAFDVAFPFRPEEEDDA
ncbi:MAG: MerR family transcriptional regulator [Meiothermus sp.]|nr:MerR family transcriptional regulator [Meiothermus sp.]